jgi:OmpA-OmpF porin, OOP family
MKKTIYATAQVICAAFALLANTASAQSTGTGPYVGIGINASATSTDKTTLPQVANDRNGFGGKINAGYQITPNYGVEAGWSSLGSFSETYKTASGNTTQKYKINTTYLAATGRWGITENLSVVTKAGVGFNKVSGTNVLPTTDTLLGNKTTLFSSAGFAYKLTPNMALTLDYDIAGKRSNKVYGHALTAGVQYSF